MTVCVDHRWQGHDGIARYAAEIIDRLPQADAITSPRIRPASPADPWWLGYVLRRRQADLYFSPGFNAAASRIPQLVVLHDLIHLQFPAESTAVKRAYYERIVKPAVLRTGAVVTVSEFSKATIVEWCGIDPLSVTVASGALSRAFRCAGPAIDRPRDGDDRKPYVLYVGNGKPHKNLNLLLGAMKVLPELRLVSVGATPPCGRDHPSPPPAEVEVLSGLSDEALADLYRGAACLAFPSLYEGFGLPALEALSQGTPVAYVCEAVRETVGPECGVQGDLAGGVDDFADCIRRAIALRTSPAFAVRAAERASSYSWEESAARITTTLERLSSAR